jgi:hypothetical protein
MCSPEDEREGAVRAQVRDEGEEDGQQGMCVPGGGVGREAGALGDECQIRRHRADLGQGEVEAAEGRAGAGAWASSAGRQLGWPGRRLAGAGGADVALLHRRADLAETMSSYLLDELDRNGAVIRDAAKSPS